MKSERRKIWGFLMFVVIFAILALSVSVGCSAASTYTVCPSGCDYSSIQAAINAAKADDTIEVHSGTYNENVNVNKKLILRGVDTGGGKPVVDAGGSGSAITLSADGITLEGFKAINSGWGDAGIWVNSNNNTLTGNNASFNNRGGIEFSGSSNNVLINNTANSNIFGITLWYYSSNNTLSGNVMSGNNFNLVVEGISLSEYFHNIDTTNTVNGKPVYYWVNQKDKQVPNDAGYVGLVSSTNIAVKNLILKNNGEGILLVNTKDSIIENNTVSDNYRGIILRHYSSNNILTNNTVSNGYDGIWLFKSSNNTLSGNVMSGSQYTFFVRGGSLSAYIHNIDTTNTVNGKPVYYWVNQKDKQVPDDAGYVGLVNSTNIAVKNLTLKNNGEGILLAYTKGSVIENNTVSDNDDGIYLSSSRDNTITGNNASNNGEGISLMYSSNNILTNNTASANNHGIYFVDSSTNHLTSNSLSYNRLYAIYLWYSDTNEIYLNNFINNSDNVNIQNSTNFWNSTEPLTYQYHGSTFTSYTGNYWGDYTGSDADGDGIGDTSYPIDLDKDNYPLMEPFEAYVIAPTEPYTKIEVGVTSNITLANPDDIALYLPPEYAGMDISDSIVLNVNVTDINENSTDEAYTDITIKVGELEVETCKVFKTEIGFLPEVEDVATLPTLKPPGEPAFSRDLVNKTVTVRLYVGDPLLGVIPSATPSVFDTGFGTYPSIMGTHNGTITPNQTLMVSKLYTYPCTGTGGHTVSIKLYENGDLIANGTWNGYKGDWHNITIHNLTGGTPYVTLLENHEYNYTIITGSYPQIIHAKEHEAKEGGNITCSEFIDANGKIYYDWIPAIRLE